MGQSARKGRDWPPVPPVEEKFPKENFRVNREMRDEILVYESILEQILRKWYRNAGKIVSKFQF